MALKIDEEWVTNRIELKHDKLEDVRTLALPGNYHEKIGALSTSLSNFSRLLELDLSRNAISNLDGLSHLKHLEILNLYYNQVPDLKETFKLRKNQNLRTLDLRLNPVTKTEADYRLFVVHMLPFLTTFDDRPVRENERKAALMHFSNEQAADMDDHTQTKCSEMEEPRTLSQPRAQYVKNHVKRPTYVDDEDTCLDVLDLVKRNGDNVRNPRYHTGGVREQPQADDHTHEELLRIAQKENPIQRQNKDLIADFRVRDSKETEHRSNKKSAPIRNEYDDEEIHTKFKSVANFTRHPGSVAPPPTAAAAKANDPRHPSSEHSEASFSTENEYSSLPDVKRLSFGNSNGSGDSVQTQFLDNLLDLVDKYWNGSKSLHYHKKFKSLAEKPLSAFQESVAGSKDIQIRALHDKMVTLASENKKLHARLHSASKLKSATGNDFTDNRKEMEALRSRLQLSTNDNKILRKKISEIDDKTHKENDQLAETEKQKRSLTQQVANMRFQLKNYESLDDLTKMLQESHKSLISTNDKLLSELDETRNRHQNEVEQLKWSYDQLRKTSHLLSSHVDGDLSNGY